VVVRLVWVWVRTSAWVLLQGQLESIGHIAYTLDGKLPFDAKKMLTYMITKGK